MNVTDAISHRLDAILKPRPSTPVSPTARSREGLGRGDLISNWSGQQRGGGHIGATAPLDIGVAAADDAKPALTVDGLLEAWGTKNQDYDLDGNGKVGMRDLVALLAQLAGGGKPPAPTEATVGTTEGPETGVAAPADPVDTPAEMTVDGLLAAWGQRGSDYDLDGDGSVSMEDLRLLLAQLGGNGEDVSDPAKLVPGADTGVTQGPEIVAGEPGSTDPVLTLKGLLDAWGERNEMYDLDGNGRVGMSDLLRLLSEMQGDGDAAAYAQAPELPGLGVARGPSIRAHAAYDTPAGSRVAPLAASLMNRLEQHGFGVHPPANIHEIVSNMKLAPNETKGLMSELGSKYPRGLGVNFVG